jgi:hypothetical protein
MSICVKVILLFISIIIIKNLAQLSNGNNLRKVTVLIKPQVLEATNIQNSFTASDEKIKQLNNFLAYEHNKNIKITKTKTRTKSAAPINDFYADDDNETFYYLKQNKKLRKI